MSTEAHPATDHATAAPAPATLPKDDAQVSGPVQSIKPAAKPKAPAKKPTLTPSQKVLADALAAQKVADEVKYQDGQKAVHAVLLRADSGLAGSM